MMTLYPDEFADPTHFVIRCHDTTMTMVSTEHVRADHYVTDRITRRCPICGACVTTALIGPPPPEDT
jgi:hypothetical protein